jgi:hypothetical protein
MDAKQRNSTADGRRFTRINQDQREWTRIFCRTDVIQRWEGAHGNLNRGWTRICADFTREPNPTKRLETRDPGMSLLSSGRLEPLRRRICAICVICGSFISVIRGHCSSPPLIRVHLRLWLDQGFAEHFVDSADGTELKALFRFRGHFFEVFFVGFREKHEVDTGAQGGETFFF